jgi:activator of HSP90 ATPase
MKTDNIKQTAIFKATTQEVYEALMDANKHARFTNADASIDNTIKGKFSVYDGYCHGYNIELVPHNKIVQAWHFAEDGWPDDHYSICTFLFEQNGNETKLNFLQTDVPEHKFDALTQGWIDFYWQPLNEYLLT